MIVRGRPHNLCQQAKDDTPRELIRRSKLCVICNLREGRSSQHAPVHRRTCIQHICMRTRSHAPSIPQQTYCCFYVYLFLLFKKKKTVRGKTDVHGTSASQLPNGFSLCYYFLAKYYVFVGLKIELPGLVWTEQLVGTLETRKAEVGWGVRTRKCNGKMCVNQMHCEDDANK